MLAVPGVEPRLQLVAAGQQLGRARGEPLVQPGQRRPEPLRRAGPPPAAARPPRRRPARGPPAGRRSRSAHPRCPPSPVRRRCRVLLPLPGVLHAPRGPRRIPRPRRPVRRLGRGPIARRTVWPGSSRGRSHAGGGAGGAVDSGPRGVRTGAEPRTTCSPTRSSAAPTSATGSPGTGSSPSWCCSPATPPRSRRPCGCAPSTACRSWPAAPGTGLSGGALPVADGVVISLARLKRVLEVDPVDRRAVVEPGVTNLEITAAAAPHGLYYAPVAIASLHTDAPDFEGRYRIAETAIFEALERTARPSAARDGRGRATRAPPRPRPFPRTGSRRASAARSTIHAVEVAKDAIAAGEAIQVVLARRQSFDLPADPATGAAARRDRRSTGRSAGSTPARTCSSSGCRRSRSSARARSSSSRSRATG